MLQRPQAGEYTTFHATYIALVPEDDILAALDGQIEIVRLFVAAITPEQEAFRYAPKKWSVRQVFGHLADAERIFGYRALCIARGQAEALPQFDENLFVETANFDQRQLADLSAEWQRLREASLSMLRGLDPAAWTRTCIVSGSAVSTRAIAWITAGHLRHHLAIFRDRYGLTSQPD
jgi:hypothetical protein